MNPKRSWAFGAVKDDQSCFLHPLTNDQRNVCAPLIDVHKTRTANQLLFVGNRRNLVCGSSLFTRLREFYDCRALSAANFHNEFHHRDVFRNVFLLCAAANAKQTSRKTRALRRKLSCGFAATSALDEPRNYESKAINVRSLAPVTTASRMPGALICFKNKYL